MFEELLAVLPDEPPVGPEDHGRVVAKVMVGLEHAGDQMNIELVSQSYQPLEVWARGYRLAERAVGLKWDQLVGDRISIEEAFRRDDDFRPARGSLPDERLDPAIVHLLVTADPLQDDPGNPDSLALRTNQHSDTLERHASRLQSRGFLVARLSPRIRG